jgi:hypothetical protein
MSPFLSVLSQTIVTLLTLHSIVVPIADNYSMERARTSSTLLYRRKKNLLSSSCR